MPIFANLLAAPCIVALLCLAGSPPVLAQQKPADQPAARQPGAKPAAPAPAGKAPIDKFSVVSQTWHRFPGLAVADITFQNGNNFRVRDAVIACEFLDAKGKLLATRAALHCVGAGSPSTSRSVGSAASAIAAWPSAVGCSAPP